MTKQKAIKIIEQFIKFKEDSVESMNRLQFQGHMKDVHKRLIQIAEIEKQLLEKALSELNSKK